MLKKTMIRIAKVAVLASLIVSTVFVAGCQYDIKVKYNGHLYNGLCYLGGEECEVSVEVSGGGENKG